jgi:glycosyltransferase involved in cell wall biosynthesis
MSVETSARRTICVIAYDGETNPATRLRIMQFYQMLKAAGYAIVPIYLPYAGASARSLRALARSVRAADVVFVQRVLTWWLLPLLQLLGRPIIFDVDDALQYIRQSQFESALSPSTIRQRLTVLYRRVIRGGEFYSSRKRYFDRMVRVASGVIVGNDNLAEHVGSMARKRIVLPTSVAVETFPQHEHGDVAAVRIGWIGVSSNLYHLRLLERVFEQLSRRFGERVRLVIVSNRGLDDLPIATEFIEWSLETESAVTAGFDIGIMPLQDDFFSRGKCSFKAIYCMGHGVPVVISPVGMNAQLVEDGINGFLADSDQEWIEALSRLVDDASLRARCGRAARETIERHYSARSIFPRLRQFLDEAADAG